MSMFDEFQEKQFDEISSADDKLNRGAEIQRITFLLRAMDGPFSLALDAPWGHGKTTFVKLFKDHLESEHSIGCIYLNAWENDHVDDPLASLVAQMDGYFSEEKTLTDKAKKAWKNAISKVPTLLLNKGVPTVLKMAGVPHLAETSKPFIERIKIAADIICKKHSKDSDWLERQKGSMTAMKEFQDSFKTAVGGFPLPNGWAGIRLVVFVDELDRCRPSHAVGMLERIKHLFGVPGVAFVLSVNLEQLAETVKNVYGQGFDGRGYLERFFNCTYPLKFDAELYLEHVLNLQGFQYALFPKDKDNQSNHWFRDAILMISKRLNWGARDINRLSLRLQVIMHSDIVRPKVGGMFATSPFIITFLAVLHDEDAQLYRRYKLGQDASAVFEVIERFTGVTREAGWKDFPRKSGHLIGTIFAMSGNIETWPDLKVRNSDEEYEQLLPDVWKKPYDGGMRHEQVVTEINDIIKSLGHFVENDYGSITMNEYRDSLFDAVEFLLELDVAAEFSLELKMGRTEDLPDHLLQALSRPISEEEYKEGKAQVLPSGKG